MITNLNFSAPINDRSYGLVGLNTLVELQKLGVSVALFPIGQIQCEKKYENNVRKALQTAQMPDFAAPSLRLYHEFSLAEHVGWGDKIGWPIFERNVFNEQQIHHLRNQDKLFVCSQWGKDVLVNNLKGKLGGTRGMFQLPLKWEDFIHVIPLGVDRTIFNENYLNKYRSPKTIFWHQGKIEVRKGHDILHKIFKEAFPTEDNVELWISWYNPFLSQEEVQQWEDMYRTTLGDRVRFIPWTENPRELAQTMSQTDAGIWLSRSEGFCLPCLEYLSMGKAVIGPNYSGFTEYLDNSNSYMIDCDEMEEMYDGVWFVNEKSTWMSYGDKQISQTIAHLRVIHKMRQKNIKLDPNRNGIETAKKFSWENTAKSIVKELR